MEKEKTGQEIFDEMMQTLKDLTPKIEVHIGSIPEDIARKYITKALHQYYIDIGEQKDIEFVENLLK